MTPLAMRNHLGFLGASLLLAFPIVSALSAQEWKSGIEWPVREIVDPGPAEPAAPPPSDAIVLFDGSNLDQWHHGDQWKIEDGFAVASGSDITTRESFGDYQLHVEWATPPDGSPGNSGVYLASRYELQIIDSYERESPPDGQCGAVYKQHPPLVNASRPPGEWQTFHIIFRAPRFDAEGELLEPAYVTVLHNGVLIHNHAEIQGSTAWDRPPIYEPHPIEQPILLQYHGDPVRFRNIWIRPL